MMDRNLSPLKIVLYFTVFGFLWIISSDVLVSKITKDPEIYTKLSIVKGWLFIMLTAAFLYWLVSLYSEQRTRSEIALRENEQRFRVFFESHGSVMMLIDPDTGGIVDANRAAADYYGFTRDTLRGMAISDINLLPPEELTTQRRRAVVNPYNLFVVPHRVAGGEVRTVEVHTSPIEVNQKKLLFSIIHDISERKRAEEEIAERVAMVQQIMDTASVGIGLVDKRGRITHANRRMAEMFGCVTEELIGSEYPDHVHLSERETSRRNMLALLASAIPSVDLERRYTRKDGTEFWGHLSCKRFHDSQGNELGLIGVITDITERKRAENELKIYRDHLEELVEERTKEVSVLNDQLRQSQKLEAVGLLAGGIAHDFSNILTTIKGSMYLIQNHMKEDNPLLEYAELVMSSISKANNLSQSLLAFSRKQTFILQPLELHEIIEKTMKLLAQVLGEHIRLNISLTSRETVILADRNQMEQILLNLATNARDAMPDGGILAIQTDIILMDDEFIRKHGYGAAGKYVLMSVSDSGTGMGEDIREKIFEPFFTTKESGKGSGLGLAVIYGIVKQHNGYIFCETAPQQGTTFRIYLPAVETVPTQNKREEVLSISGGTETILLAEDDTDTRRTLSEVLRLCGYTVLEAGDGKEAVRIYSEHRERIDLAVLDVRMPEMTGREVYEEIMRLTPQAAVLFMSGYTDDIINSEGILERELNFISKAALPAEILRKVREVLDK
jgi:two-component system cell cycle sensor histidine kinase/response regulator CckA